MATRLEFHQALQTATCLKNLYYQPPETVKMKYPCLVYQKEAIDSQYADDMAYRSMNRYQVTVIDRVVDSPYTTALLDGFQYTRFSRHYAVDNLHHDVLTIYY